MSTGAKKQKINDLDQLPGIGSAVMRQLAELGIHSTMDLIRLVPTRWEDFSILKRINDLQIGDQVSCFGRISHIATKKVFRRRRMTITEMVVEDETGALVLTWFHYFKGMKLFEVGDEVLLRGVVRFGARGRTMSHPSIEKITSSATGAIVPIYSQTLGLSHHKLQQWISLAIEKNKDSLLAVVPPEYQNKRKLISYYDALQGIHAPRSVDHLTQAKKYFAYSEILPLQLSIMIKKQELMQYRAPRIVVTQDWVASSLDGLPYVLSGDQKKVIQDIFIDLQKEAPMNRLVEGDVGSGKTIVAFIAMHAVVTQGYQVVMLAPTEILAMQHYESAREFFASRGIQVGLMTSKGGYVDGVSGGRGSKKLLSDMIEQQQVRVVIGTHALLSEKIVFGSVGMVVVDEQHRFGVSQRKKIKEKAGSMSDQTLPHFLSLTATPIPRTLALALYGDLEISLIKQKPSHQKPIKSYYVPNEKRKDAYAFIDKQIAEGAQVYIVCPVIESAQESIQVATKKAVMDEYEKIHTIFHHRRCAYLHGRIKKEQQQRTIQGFYEGTVDILVATSIIEVGVNVPNAAIMMIESADRFGLAQLHQLRGRVGRGERQSYCLLFSDTTLQHAQERLKQFASISDGFSLSEFDLAERGPGEFWGVEQSGFPRLHFAKLNDVELISQAQEDAKAILAEKNWSVSYPVLFEQASQKDIINHEE